MDQDFPSASLFERPRLWVLAAVLALSAAAGALGCGEATLKELTPTPPIPDGPSIKFRQGVLAVFAARDCAGVACHTTSDGTPAQSGLNLGGDDVTPKEVYDGIIAGGALNGTDAGFDVNLDSPAESLLLTKPFADSGEGHGGGKAFQTTDDPGYLSIIGWIESGAPYN